jgi:uncharacterized membrane protein YeaQ/YmgE (transglycosylase-associated protein family)
MNLVLWLLAGAVVGWIACSAMNMNTHRGLVVSAIIGVAGGFFGGHVLAPMVGTLEEAGGFNPIALLMAIVVAIACVTISDMMYERFGM